MDIGAMTPQLPRHTSNFSTRSGDVFVREFHDKQSAVKELVLLLNFVFIVHCVIFIVWFNTHCS